MLGKRPLNGEDDTLWLKAGLTLGDVALIDDEADQDAPGTWARVATAHPIIGCELPASFAVKVLRDRHVGKLERHNYFLEEAQLLDLLRPLGQIPALLGYGQLAPTDGEGNPAAGLRWSRSLEEFEKSLTRDEGDGWRPFLFLEHLRFDDTLLGQLRVFGPYVGAPVWEIFSIGHEIAQLLQKCHERRLYYMDHKLEHVVFDPTGPKDERVRMIDWNACTWRPGALEEDVGWLVREDLQRFACRILYPMCSGRTIEGEPVSAYNGNVMSVRPPLRHDGLLVDFGPAGRHLDFELQRILSLAMNPSGVDQFESAEIFAAALESYAEKWLEKAGPVARSLQRLWAEVKEAAASPLPSRERLLREYRDSTFRKMREDFSGDPLLGEVRRLYLFVDQMLKSAERVNKQIGPLNS